MNTLKKIRFLNSNTLKILAAVLMLVDHVGILFFPQDFIFRKIGRLSMPLFAFAISEGCRYTRDKLKHFVLPFCLGVLCQIVYYFFDGSLYMCILITFSLSILIIYAMQFLKQKLFDKQARLSTKILAVLLFIATLVGANLFCNLKGLDVDYGFWGVMTPVFASLFDFKNTNAPELLQKTDILPLRVACMAIPLLFLANHTVFSLSIFALLALPILLLYNGEKGKTNLKYFFYIFYPAHLAILEGVYLLLYVF